LLLLTILPNIAALLQAKEMILSMITDFAAPLDLFGNWALNLGFFAACGTLLYALVISPKQ
jgi:hypothetical protein